MVTSSQRMYVGIAVYDFFNIKFSNLRPLIVNYEFNGNCVSPADSDQLFMLNRYVYICSYTAHINLCTCMFAFALCIYICVHLKLSLS